MSTCYECGQNECECAARSLPEVLGAVVLGPEDRLVVVGPDDVPMSERVKAAEMAEKFAPGRVMVLFGAEAFAIRATKAEGSTVGQCGDWLPNLFPGSVDPSATCHLAHGHTGMHSDGEATWSNGGSRSDEG